MTEVISHLQGCTLQGGNAPVSFPPSSSHYAETVDFQREDTAPPVLGSSPLDDLFTSKPVQITERLIAPSRRYRKRWTKQQKVLVASVTAGVAAFFLLFGIIAKLAQSPSTAVRMESPSAAAKKPVESGRTVVLRSEVPPPTVARSVAEKAKPENLQPKVVPAGAVSPPSSDPDREAAQWVLRNGGTVMMHSDGKNIEVKSLGELPSARFWVWQCDFSGNSSLGDDVFDHLRGLNLGNLLLNKTRVTGQGLAGMQIAKTLKILFLSGTQVNDATLRELRGMTSLWLLALDSTSVSDAGLEHLSGLVALKQLQLNSTRVSGPGLKHFQKLSLEHLFLGATPLTDVGLEQLKEMKSLRNLNVYSTQVTDGGMKYLAGLPGLTELDLVGTQVSDAGLADLKATPLESLHVAGTRITCNGLAKLRGLKSLDIGPQQVTQNGLRRLAGLPSLKAMTVRWVTDTSLGHLRVMKKLTELHFAEARVTVAGVEALKASLPNCKITW